MNRYFDFTEVIKALQRDLVSDRKNLLAIIQKEMGYNETCKRFTAELAALAAINQVSPVELLQFGLRQGILLGILLERERLTRGVH